MWPKERKKIDSCSYRGQILSLWVVTVLLLTSTPLVRNTRKKMIRRQKLDDWYRKILKLFLKYLAFLKSTSGDIFSMAPVYTLEYMDRSLFFAYLGMLQDRCHQWSIRPDPQSRQKWTLFSLEICFVLKSGDGRTTCAKTMITTGFDCGSASWIKNLWGLEIGLTSSLVSCVGKSKNLKNFIFILFFVTCYFRPELEIVNWTWK